MNQAVQRVRDAIQLFNKQHSNQQDLFIAGSIGPTPKVNESPEEIRALDTFKF